MQSRLVFGTDTLELKFDRGVGDLEANNVLAIVLDDELILPNGIRLPFSGVNVRKIQREFITIIDEDDLIIDEDDLIVNEDEIASPSDAPREDEEVIEDDEIIEDDEVITASPSNAVYTMSSRRRSAPVVGDTVAFTVDGDIIALDEDYFTSLNLSVGDHLIGAIFDNTEHTTDVKKVILSIPEEPEEPEEPVIPPVDPEEPIIPPVEPEIPSTEPEEPEEPIIPPTELEVPTTPSGGGGSGSGGNTKPSTPDTGNVPDSGGDFEGNGNDWEYIKPNGDKAKDEWVGDGENWYHIGEDSLMDYDWFYAKDLNWYMLNREHDGSFGAAKTAWYHENQDSKWYYLNTKDNAMYTGWQQIAGKWYYFTPANEGPTYFGDSLNGWKYDSTRHTKPYGSMYVSEVTPDGYTVGAGGACQ